MPSIPSLVRLATAAALFLASSSLASLNPTFTRRENLPLNPPSTDLNTLKGVSLAAVRGLDTNAQRLARGLSPLPPRSAWRRGDRSRPHVVRRSQPSGTSCKKMVGGIEIVDATTGALLGHVADEVNEFGEYGVTSEPLEALEINFKLCKATGVVGPFDITQMNTCGCMPYKNVGAIQGYSSSSVDLVAGGHSYLVFGGVTLTDSITGPSTTANSFSYTTNIQRAAESDVWHYDTATSQLLLKWVNSDSTTPAIQFAICHGVLIAVADVNAAIAALGPFTLVNLRFALSA